MRLIDTDAMNEELFYKQIGGKNTLITVEAAFNMIKAQPTAYDVDVVIEYLEELRDRFNKKDFAIRGIIEKSIEIVKAGGIN